MSKPQFFATHGFGERKLKAAHYAQAVKIGNIRKSWKMKSSRHLIMSPRPYLGNGRCRLGHVISANSYHVDFTPDINDIMIALFRKYMPNHQPIRTLLGVAALGEPQMRMEIRVTAIVD